jgi:hypothetical protein
MYVINFLNLWNTNAQQHPLILWEEFRHYNPYLSNLTAGPQVCQTCVTCCKLQEIQIWAQASNIEQEN